MRVTGATSKLNTDSGDNCGGLEGQHHRALVYEVQVLCVVSGQQVATSVAMLVEEVDREEALHTWRVVWLL